MKLPDFDVGDLFCGAGGSSAGAERAIKELGRRMKLICVNHWPVAIETHKRNHPNAQHYVEDLAVADPYKLVPKGRLDLLMASPECRFWSRARGGKPVFDQGRMNPWAVHRWLTSIDVRCLLVENVPEFVLWGPLLDNGTPDPRHRGEYFQSWFFALEKMGYRAEWKYLNAADYGDATTRTRFFLIARKDVRPIRWPEPTHSASGEPTMLGRLPRWRAAREIIQWDNPGRSLLDDPKYLRRPLSEKTRHRIARGLQKFGGSLAPLYIQLLGLPAADGKGGEAQPFVMGKNGNSPAYRGVNQPIPTATTDGRSVLIDPTVEPFVLGQQSTSAPRGVSQPIPTVATHGAISVIKPLMIKYHGNERSCQPVDDPVPTLTTKDRVGLVNSMVIPCRGEREGQKPRVHSVDEPVPTITTKAGLALANPAIIPYYGDHKGKKEPRAHSVEEPLKTITGDPRFGLANPVLIEVNHSDPFLIQWDQTGSNGSGVRPVSSPVPTILTKQNTGVVEPRTIALVEPILKRLESGDIDPRRLVMIDNEPYLLDIRFRMLTNLELARATGFTDQETTYEFVGNASEVTKQIGNAVPVNMAKALVLAILKE